MENEITLEPKELFVEIERKYISYLLNGNEFDSLGFDKTFFLNLVLRAMFVNIKKIAVSKTPLVIDTLYDMMIHIKSDIITKDEIIGIKNGYTDFRDIDRTKRQLKENYLKETSTKTILKNILTEVTGSGELDMDKLNSYKNDLSDLLIKIENDNENLLDLETIIEKETKEIFRRRDVGDKGRTTGLSYLDNMITYRFEAGDITTIAMRKGAGKTTVSLNIVNSLLNLGVPVVYFCLDMGHNTVVDRLLCMRESITNNQIFTIGKPPVLKEQINFGLDEMSKIKNFILYPQGSISLNAFESYIMRIKKQFYDKGVFTKGCDEYFLAVFDTIDMVEDFSGAGDAYGIKKAINKQSAILKKHGVGCLNLNQLNENQIRMHKPKRIDDVDFLKFTKEDIEGGSSYASRSRVVIIGTRPKEMKKSFFPEEEELLELEDDVLHLYIDKQNDGPVGKIKEKLIFDYNTFKIYPIKGE